MARALRDVAQPSRLQLYDYPEARQQLAHSAPWFLQLLEPVSDIAAAAARRGCSSPSSFLAPLKIEAQMQNPHAGADASSSAETSSLRAETSSPNAETSSTSVELSGWGK